MKRAGWSTQRRVAHGTKMKAAWTAQRRAAQAHSPNLHPRKASTRLSRLQLDTQVLKQLRPRERRIVVCRTGLDGAPPAPLQGLARELHITRERVRQIETEIIRKICRYRRDHPMPEAAGCIHREYEDGPRCNKVCDPGQVHCPHHLLLQTSKPKPPAREDGNRRYRTPRGYDE